MILSETNFQGICFNVEVFLEITGNYKILNVFSIILSIL